jgi:hypothetical protein
MERKKLHDLINELKHLHLREAELITLIDEAAANAGQSVTSGATVDHEVFEEGDRVRVKNQVKKPANWGSDVWNHRQARLATVTFATTERVYFVTDNGVTTWRAPHNLQRL